jgi:protein phosphatase
MPWSAKAQELLRQQYAPTGAAATSSLARGHHSVESGWRSNPEIAALAEQYQQRKEAANLYVEAYQRYCWTVHSLADLKLAPFHLLASEGASTPRTIICGTWKRLRESVRPILVCCSRHHFKLWTSPTRAEQEKGIKWWEETDGKPAAKAWL